jgi:hypothetical protein
MATRAEIIANAAAGNNVFGGIIDPARINQLLADAGIGSLGEGALPSYVTYTDDGRLTFGADTSNSEVINTLKLLGQISDADYNWFMKYFSESPQGANENWIAARYNDPNNDFDNTGLGGFNTENQSRFERVFNSLRSAKESGGFAPPAGFTVPQSVAQPGQPGQTNTASTPFNRPVFIGQPPTGGTANRPYYSTSDILVTGDELPDIYGGQSPYDFTPLENPYDRPVVMNKPYQPPTRPTPPLVFDTKPGTPLDPFPQPGPVNPVIPGPNTPPPTSGPTPTPPTPAGPTTPTGPTEPTPTPDDPRFRTFDKGVSLIFDKDWGSMSDVEKLAHTIARGENWYSSQYANTPLYAEAQKLLQDKFGNQLSDMEKALRYEAIDRAYHGQTHAERNTLDAMLKAAGFNSYDEYLAADTGNFQKNMLGQKDYFDYGVPSMAGQLPSETVMNDNGGLTFGGAAAPSQPPAPRPTAPAPVQQPTPQPPSSGGDLTFGGLPTPAPTPAPVPAPAPPPAQPTAPAPAVPPAPVNTGPTQAEIAAAQQKAAQEAAAQQKAAQEAAARRAAAIAQEEMLAQQRAALEAAKNSPAPIIGGGPTYLGGAQKNVRNAVLKAEGGIIDVAESRGFSPVTGEGIESFLMEYQSPEVINQQRASATLKRNLKMLQQQQQAQQQQQGPQPTAQGPNPTMQQGIMPMAGR